MGYFQRIALPLPDTQAILQFQFGGAARHVVILAGQGPLELTSGLTTTRVNPRGEAVQRSAAIPWCRRRTCVEFVGPHGAL